MDTEIVLTITRGSEGRKIEAFTTPAYARRVLERTLQEAFSVPAPSAEPLYLQPDQILTNDSRQPRDEPPYRFDEPEVIL